MEGVVAKWYAGLTRKALNDFRELAARVASEVPPAASVLEVAPGPGYFAIELARLGPYRVTGLDISRTFVEIARRNARKASVEVDFRVGNASEMPFAGDAFDYILCRAAFKNFAEPGKALREMNRVLKPGGLARIIDLRGDTSKQELSHAVDDMHLGLVNTVITKLTFRHMLLKRAYTKAEFERMLDGVEFRSADIVENGTGLEVRLIK